MMSTKRVLLADGSRLLREMLHHALDKAEHLRVVQELPDPRELPSALKRFDPTWVIVPSPYDDQARDWLDGCMADHPTVRFLFVPPGPNPVKMKWQTSYEENFTDLSLQEFLEILAKDLQPT